MRNFVITAAQEPLQYDDEREVYRALITTSDYALVSVQDVFEIDPENWVATIVVVEPVVLDDEGRPVSLEELDQIKAEALAAEAEEAKPKPKGGRRSRKGLEVIEGGGDEE